MEIVENTPNDLTVHDVARLAGRSVKTVRRAVHAGQLPMRYVLGLRGPQLVFLPEEIEHWQLKRTDGRRKPRAARKRRTGSARGSGATAALRAALEEQRAIIDQLSAKLGDQEIRLSRLQAMIDGMLQTVPIAEESFVQ